MGGNNLCTESNFFQNNAKKPVLQSKSSTLTTQNQDIIPDIGYDGLSNVSVPAVTKDVVGGLDANFKASNIKKDVNILGVIGEHSGFGTATIPYVEYTYDMGNRRLTNAKLYGMTIIHDNMFYNSTFLQSVDWLESPNINLIGENAFFNCSLTSFTSLPESVTSIGKRAFYNCSNLNLASLPASIITIGQNAFQGCTNLNNLEVKCITIGPGGGIFSGCSSLTKVWIRSACTTIPASSATNAPFVNCPTNLTIYVEAESKPDGWSDYFDRTGTSGTTIATVIYGQTTNPW